MYSSKTIFCNVKDGKFCTRNAEHEEEFIDLIDGYVTRIWKKVRDFRGASAVYWYISIRTQEGELYSIGLPYSSGIFKSIMLNLASDTELCSRSVVRIEPYLKDEKTKVQVYSNGVLLSWVTKELPPIKQVRVGSQTVADDTERMLFIEDLVHIVSERLGLG